MPHSDPVVVRFGGQIQLLHSTLYAAWRSTPHRPSDNAVAETRASRADCNERADGLVPAGGFEPPTY